MAQKIGEKRLSLQRGVEFVSKVVRRGGSLYVLIPYDVREKLDLKDGDRVAVRMVKIVVGKGEGNE